MHPFIDAAEVFMSGLLRLSMLFSVCYSEKQGNANILLPITLLI